jgi:hypothetical protein
LNHIIEEFNGSQENITVEAKYVPFADFKKQLSIGASADELPDLVILDNPDHAAYAAMGIFADITDKFDVSSYSAIANIAASATLNLKENTDYFASGAQVNVDGVLNLAGTAVSTGIDFNGTGDINVNDSHTFGGGGGKHNVAGCAHRCNVQINRGANQGLVGITADGGVAVDGCAQGFKALYVRVGRTCAQITTAGKRRGRSSETAELCPQNVRGAAHYTGKIQGNAVAADGTGVDAVGKAFDLLHLCAHTSDDLKG